jgi:predicted GNAT family N-acyltransferase
MRLQSFKQFVNEALIKPSKIQMDLRAKYEDCIEKLFIEEKESSIELNLIRIKPEKRGEGCATNIMNDLVDYANKTKKVIHLTPSKDFGSTIERLTEFYKRFGFVMNKGRYKDTRFRNTMIKRPE